MMMDSDDLASGDIAISAIQSNKEKETKIKPELPPRVKKTKASTIPPTPIEQKQFLPPPLPPRKNKRISKLLKRFSSSLGSNPVASSDVPIEKITSPPRAPRLSKRRSSSDRKIRISNRLLSPSASQFHPVNANKTPTKEAVSPLRLDSSPPSLSSSSIAQTTGTPSSFKHTPPLAPGQEIVKYKKRVSIWSTTSRLSKNMPLIKWVTKRFSKKSKTAEDDEQQGCDAQMNMSEKQLAITPLQPITRSGKVVVSRQPITNLSLYETIPIEAEWNLDDETFEGLCKLFGEIDMLSFKADLNQKEKEIINQSSLKLKESPKLNGSQKQILIQELGYSSKKITLVSPQTPDGLGMVSISEKENASTLSLHKRKNSPVLLQANFLEVPIEPEREDNLFFKYSQISHPNKKRS